MPELAACSAVFMRARSLQPFSHSACLNFFVRLLLVKVMSNVCSMKTAFCLFRLELQHENYTLTQKISISMNEIY